MATIDLDPAIQRAKDAVAAGLAKTQRGARINLDAPKVRISRFVPADTALVADLLFSSGAEMTFTVK